MIEIYDKQRKITSSLYNKIRELLPFTKIGKLKILSKPCVDSLDFGIHYYQKEGIVAIIDCNVYYKVYKDDDNEYSVNEMYDVFEHEIIVKE